jgi:hypothetical protein
MHPYYPKPGREVGEGGRGLGFTSEAGIHPTTLTAPQRRRRSGSALREGSPGSLLKSLTASGQPTPPPSTTPDPAPSTAPPRRSAFGLRLTPPGRGASPSARPGRPGPSPRTPLHRQTMGPDARPPASPRFPRPPVSLAPSWPTDPADDPASPALTIRDSCWTCHCSCRRRHRRPCCRSRRPDSPRHG